jgi:uncharacterized protein YqjF (DUF2071 family)
MLLSMALRDLVLATWATERERVARTLPPGLEPAEVGGAHVVSLAAFRCTGGRLGVVPVPAYSQLNVRVYVEHEDEPAVFFLAARVTLPGLGGALFGAPYRPARIRVLNGGVEAPGLGVSLRYRREGPGHPAALGEHSLGIYEAAGLRAFRIRRGEALWETAALVSDVRAEPLVALGFDLHERPTMLYAERASFETEVPPAKISINHSRQ